MLSLRLANLTLSEKGGLPGSSSFARLVRGAIWLDIAALRLEWEGNTFTQEQLDSLEVFDNLIQETVEDDVGTWLSADRFTLPWIADIFVQNSLWTRHRGPLNLHRRYRPIDERERLWDLDRRISDLTGATDPSDIIVTCLATTGHLLGENRRAGYGNEPEPWPDFTWRRLGRMREPCQQVDEFLRWSRREDRIASSIWKVT